MKLLEQEGNLRDKVEDSRKTQREAERKKWDNKENAAEAASDSKRKVRQTPMKGADSTRAAPAVGSAEPTASETNAKGSRTNQEDDDVIVTRRSEDLLPPASSAK